MERTSIVIIGTGFAGLGMAIRLKQAGIDDFVIFEQSADLGGTWRDNHYPGAACDIESHLYSFSFEPNPGWTRMFAPQAEILAYLRHCAEKYDILRHISFNSTVAKGTFDKKSNEWTIKLVDGRTVQAPVVVSGCGGLSRPTLPEIEGIDTFAGKWFHSARWDANYDLSGKTVAVIGTGASSIQVVPAIAGTVKKLHLFQRTPPWIMPRPDRAMREVERVLFAQLPQMQTVLRARIFWRHELGAYGFTVNPKIMRLGAYLGKRFLAREVRDSALRERLTPKYTFGCKRVLISNDYYEAVQRPNVDLVTVGIKRVVPRGVEMVDGSVVVVDAIVYCTGFEAAECAAPFELKGIDGQDLNDEWKSGAEAYLGMTVTGFPNMFMIVGPNTGLGHSSMVFMIESQIAYILSCLQWMRFKNVKRVDVMADAQARFNKHLHARLAKTVWATDCNAWYRTRSGKNTTLWPGFTVEFRWRTRRFDPSVYLTA